MDFPMRKMIILVLFSMIALSNAGNFQYPPAPKDNTVDDYFGTKVADPYRPLENPDSPETRAWIQAEDKLTSGYLSQIPQRENIRKRITDLWNFEKYEVPYHQGGRYFYLKNNGRS